MRECHMKQREKRLQLKLSAVHNLQTVVFIPPTFNSVNSNQILVTFMLDIDGKTLRFVNYMCRHVYYSQPPLSLA